MVRSGKGKRPEGYAPPPKAELEELRTQEGEQLRSGRKLGGAPDLEAVLDRYMGEAGGPQKQPEAQKQGGRRSRGQGKSAQGQPRQEKPQRPPQPQKQAQPKPSPQQDGQPAQAGGQNHKRRYRPHHRRKPGGGQGGAQPPQA